MRPAHLCSTVSGISARTWKRGSNQENTHSLVCHTVDAGGDFNWAVDCSIHTWLSMWPGLSCNMMDDSQRHVFWDRKRDREIHRERQRDRKTKREREMGKWDDAISFYYLCSEDKRHHFHYPLLDRTVIGGGNTDPSSMWEECQPLYKKSIWDKIGSTLKNTSYHHQY